MLQCFPKCDLQRLMEHISHIQRRKLKFPPLDQLQPVAQKLGVSTGRIPLQSGHTAPQRISVEKPCRRICDPISSIYEKGSLCQPDQFLSGIRICIQTGVQLFPVFRCLPAFPVLHSSCQILKRLQLCEYGHLLLPLLLRKQAERSGTAGSDTGTGFVFLPFHLPPHRRSTVPPRALSPYNRNRTGRSCRFPVQTVPASHRGPVPPGPAPTKARRLRCF